MKPLLLTAAAFSWLLLSVILFPAYAQENIKPISEDSHIAHDDVDKHNENDNSHDEHGHGDLRVEHDNAHTKDGSHDDKKTKISPESAKRMGIVIEKSAPAKVNQMISLTGRITLNQNAIAGVHGRYTGIVRSVKVNLGERVTKDQVLAVIEANDSLQDYNVVAPISGIVLERNTNIGDLAGDDPIFVIADLSNVWAKFHVFLRDSDFIHIGQKVAIHTLSRSKTTHGKIDMFYPTTDELSQTQIAIVILPNPERIWKPGMIIEGDVSLAEDTEAQISVRDNALQIMKGYGEVVFVKEGEFFVPRTVETGRRGNGFVEVTKGLEVGELYVSDGSFIIKSDILKATAAHSH